MNRGKQEKNERRRDGKWTDADGHTNKGQRDRNWTQEDMGTKKDRRTGGEQRKTGICKKGQTDRGLDRENHE